MLSNESTVCTADLLLFVIDSTECANSIFVKTSGAIFLAREVFISGILPLLSVKAVVRFFLTALSAMMEETASSLSFNAGFSLWYAKNKNLFYLLFVFPSLFNSIDLNISIKIDTLGTIRRYLPLFVKTK